MASNSTIFLFLFFVTPFFHNISIIADTNLIEKTCKDTKYYNLCVSSLKSNPTSAKTRDAKGLAAIMVGVGMANATATSMYLSSKLLSATNDTNLRQVLRDCANKYASADDALQASVQDLAVEGYDYAYMHVMAAADYPNVCHNGFRRYPGMAYPPEIGRREDGLKRICEVILEIIEAISNNW
ncbi:cell wall / vacuolar inhibitor of fructosidase 2-like [Tripterygium wilfordii]|uniref:Cell wall / vacuolar inhibitor of fructosidase 2-like n=1 Tax=Tripterygium wilfordii TaxID=458696 RepID=A0A7J7C0T6_TRIWF|nr:cell wall / vacuolar inhibitor of fructosidase 2 [Tripterygium wilfordii]KAF5727708.1 cell wall / vacuolar inhibitor of fructosidase 2-like [Tripterygium wilfordii]